MSALLYASLITALPTGALTSSTATTAAGLHAALKALAAEEARLSAAVLRLEAIRTATAAEAPGLPITVSGLLQGQFETYQDSADQLKTGGGLQNRDRFSIRRARLRVGAEWTWVRLGLEVDGNTTSSAKLQLWHAEASFLWRNPDAADPWVVATVGLLDTPFGAEVLESPRLRPFAERSLASRAIFPAEPDLGVRLSGTLRFFDWSIALLNGQPLETKSGFSGLSPTAAKDLVLRFAAHGAPTESLHLSGGISVLTGRGFSPGRDAGKASVGWRDLDENGEIDGTSELQGTAGAGAVASTTFARWAVGAHLSARLLTSLGATELRAEAVLATNLDRGLYLADPVLIGIDVRELGFYAAVLQDLGPYLKIGVRFDSYDPNSDAFESRAGKIYPYPLTVRTIAALVSLSLFEHLRILAEYDFVRDAYGRTSAGVPTDRPNDGLLVRAEVSL
ncbi:MAG: hypothetical protein U1E65_03350 [Myxococcota bacterium]